MAAASHMRAGEGSHRPPEIPTPTFEICIMNVDGTGQTQLTFNGVPDLGPSWSLDGTQIVFNRMIGGGRSCSG
jgi:Tol biopolymer transport system component